MDSKHQKMSKALLLIGMISLAILSPLFQRQVRAAEEPAAGANADYEPVKAILIKRCAYCHASSGNPPFSSKFPIINKMTGADAKEAKEDYPMDELLELGSSAADGYLRALEVTIRKNKMPPIHYRAIRPWRKVTPAERQQILDWIAAVRPEWNQSAESQA